MRRRNSSMARDTSTMQHQVTRRTQGRESPSTTNEEVDPPVSPSEEKMRSANPSFGKHQLVLGTIVLTLGILLVFQNRRLEEKPPVTSIAKPKHHAKTKNKEYIQEKVQPVETPLHHQQLETERFREYPWPPRVVRAEGKIQDELLPPIGNKHHQSQHDNRPRKIHIGAEEKEAQLRILDSEEYSKKAEPMYTNNPPCEPQYEWMTQTHPTCNTFHEIDMTHMILPTKPKDPAACQFIASGGYRDVFMVRDSNWDKIALKTLRTTRDFTERHFDRHRRDAVAADRMQAVASSVNIYGFCGMSALYPFAHGGNLKSAIQRNVIEVRAEEEPWNSTTKLNIAYMVAKSLADLHNVDQEGRASVAHTDISTDQFISIQGDGYFQLNDFNRARFLRRNTKNKDRNCPFHVKSNKGKFRSPEEYLYLPETEAVDNYSMGNIFYVLLTGEYPFPDKSRSAVKKLVGKGERPSFGERLLASTDPNEQALVEAAKMLWAQDPKERATARHIQQFLESKIHGSER